MRRTISRVPAAYVGRLVDAAGREVVESAGGNLDDVRLDKWCAFRRALLAVLEAALPFEYRPAVESVLRQSGKNRAELYLPIAQRTESPGAIHPRLEPGIDALPAARVELGVLGVKHPDARMIDVDELQIVELLQQEMAGVIQNVAAPVIVHALQKHLKGDAIVQILARMDLVAEVDARLVEGIQDRRPAARQLVEGGFHQARGALRPRVDERPGQRAGKGGVG